MATMTSSVKSEFSEIRSTCAHVAHCNEVYDEIADAGKRNHCCSRLQTYSRPQRDKTQCIGSKTHTRRTGREKRSLGVFHNMPQEPATSEPSSSFSLLTARIDALFPGLPSLTAHELDSLSTCRDTPPLLVDVREPEERKWSTLKGSVTVSVAEVRLHEMSLEARRDAAIVCFCTVGLRSGAYATDLAARFGLRGIRNYSILRHVWDGRSLGAWENGGAWREVATVHMFSSRYEPLAPAGLKTVVFSPAVAFMRSLAYVPSILRAFIIRLPVWFRVRGMWMYLRYILDTQYRWRTIQ